MGHKKWLRKIFFCMALSCVTATGAMAAGSFVFTGTGVEEISVSDNIANSTTGADPEISGAKVDNLRSFTFNGNMTLEANGGDTSSAAIGVYANNTAAISVGGIISASANASIPSALGIVANNSGTVLNTAQITASSNGTNAIATGIYTQGSGDLNNTGAISSTTMGTESADANGIQVEGSPGNIANSGDITALALSEYGNSRAAGIIAAYTGAISNSGDINASADYMAYGISASYTGAISNSGDINASADSWAYGIDAYKTGADAYNTGAISNSGDITASAGYGAYGISASRTGEISNSGDINASADSWAYGISASYTGAISNSGDINASADSWAYGIYARYTGAVSNSGDITASAGYGASCIVAYDTGAISNSGNITASASSEAYGIYADNTGEISNSGDITASADSWAVGIVAYDTGEISNSGNITASAGSGAYGILAAGVDHVENTGMIAVNSDFQGDGISAHANFNPDDPGDASWNRVVNNGSIHMDASTGAGIAVNSGYWEVYNPGFIYTSNDVRTLSVGSDGSDGSDARAKLMNDFRVIFNGDPHGKEGAYVPQILVGENGYLDLNDATLVAQAGKNIAFKTPYRVIENQGSSENISGEFATLKNPNPNINVSWVDGHETGADAKVIFSYDPQVSMPAVGMRMANLGVMQFSNLIQQRTFSQLLAQHIKTQQDTLLADSGAIASDAGFLVARSGADLENAMFIRPYAKAIDRSTNGGMGYDGNLYGFVLGYERSLSPELTLGAHAGLGFGAIDFKGDGYDENNEDQTIYSLGLHAAYNPDAWHFGGSATFYAAEHEYDGKTGNLLEIDEDDDYTSYGAELEAIAGYVIPSGNWAVMPYAGLGYSWINADSHSTDADNPDWDTTYGSVDEHIARSILGAQLSGNLMWGEIKVVPTLGVRWEYALTDNNIKVEQSTLGSPSVTAEDDISRSSIIGEASIGFSKGTLNCELGGMAEYNDDYQTYGGWMTLRSAF